MWEGLHLGNWEGGGRGGRESKRGEHRAEMWGGEECIVEAERVEGEIRGI